MYSVNTAMSNAKLFSNKLIRTLRGVPRPLLIVFSVATVLLCTIVVRSLNLRPAESKISVRQSFLQDGIMLVSQNDADDVANLDQHFRSKHPSQLRKTCVSLWQPTYDQYISRKESRDQVFAERSKLIAEKKPSINEANRPVGLFDVLETEYRCAYPVTLGSKTACNVEKLFVSNHSLSYPNVLKSPCLEMSFTTDPMLDFEAKLLEMTQDKCDLHVFGFKNSMRFQMIAAKYHHTNAVYSYEDIFASKKAENDKKELIEVFPNPSLTQLIKELGRKPSITTLRIDCDDCKFVKYKSIFDECKSNQLQINQFLLQISSKEPSRTTTNSSVLIKYSETNSEAQLREFMKMADKCKLMLFSKSKICEDNHQDISCTHQLSFISQEVAFREHLLLHCPSLKNQIGETYTYSMSKK